MSAGGIKNAIVDDAVNRRIRPGNHTLVAGIGKRGKYALHALPRSPSALHKTAGDRRQLHPQPLLFEHIIRFQCIHGNKQYARSLFHNLQSFLSFEITTFTPAFSKALIWSTEAPESVIIMDTWSIPHIFTRELTPSLELSAMTTV